ncbi:MAG: cytochrome c oxidase subunit 3 [Hyphomicrobiaceae bacterium]
MADSHAKHHDYHLVDPSPWPLLASLSVLVAALGAIIWMHSLGGGSGVFGITGPWVFVAGFSGVCYIAFLWWRDVIREAHKGDHTPVVQLHLRYGMIMFIASEVMFFVAWFWAYFDASLYPSGIWHLPNVPEATGMIARNELTGGHWPPQASENFTSTFDPWGLPLVNTLILLLSGCTVTWAHHALLQDDRKGLVWGLILTVLLGATFTALQAYEYGHAAFNFAGHIYGSTFFMATGFHGAHVIIGTIFLFVCLIRAMQGDFTPKQHFGFEAAAWYWHFVDVVWLFLFFAIYVWGAGSGAGH